MMVWLFTVGIPVVKHALPDGGIVTQVYRQHPVRRPCVPYLGIYRIAGAVREPDRREMHGAAVGGELIRPESESCIVSAGDTLQEPQVSPVLEFREDGESGLGGGGVSGRALVDRDARTSVFTP